MTEILKNKAARIILAVLILVFAGILNSCKNGSESTSQSEQQGQEEIKIVEGGETGYKIVYPMSGSTAVRRAANSIAAYFAGEGIAIEAVNDGGKMNKDFPADTPEILLGATNREESKNAGQLPETGYLIRVSGNRLIIQATDDELLEIAVARFLGENGKALSEGQLILGKDFYTMSDCKTNIRSGWLLTGIPAYAGGTLAMNLYDAGYGNKHSSDKLDSSKMQLISETDENQFEDYLSLLELDGFVKVFENTADKIRACAYEYGGLRLYVYYQQAQKRVRVIWDKGSTDSPESFSYTYDPQTGDSSLLYGYGIYMSKTGLETNNCGMLQVIKLADNSLFVIDGAGSGQFDAAAVKGFLDFCREITDTPENEKIRISCWFLTHNHGDHFGGMFKVLKAYSPQISLERMATNLLPHDLHKDTSNAIKPLLDYVNAVYPECRYLKLHTGMKFDIANLSAEVLYTHEDLVLHTGNSMISDTNDGSAVVRVTVEGVSYLLLGDLNKSGEKVLVENFSDRELKSDIVQVSHHAWNYLNYIYDKAQAKYAIFPQSEGGAQRTLGIHARAVTRKVQEYAGEDNCFYSGTKTTGLLLKSGSVTVADEREVIYDSFDYIWKYVYEGADMSKIRDYAVDP